MKSIAALVIRPARHPGHAANAGVLKPLENGIRLGMELICSGIL